MNHDNSFSDVGVLPRAEEGGDMQLACIGSIFAPASVAIIGASDDIRRIGGRPLRYLRESGFAGCIYPVNPNRDVVQGLKTYPTVDCIPGLVDLAIVALPADLVVAALEACAAKGVKAAIVFSAGFAEADNEGERRQHAMLKIARNSGMRILGPNCLGAFNMHTGFVGTFTQALDQGFVDAGPIAIASQSGACGGHLAYLCRQRGIGIGYWITTGNEADIGLSESMLWLARSPKVRVIVAYAEAIRDGAMFIEALRVARASGKAIVMLKVGRSAAGARAAASHTGALAGEDAVYDAAMRQYGVHRAGSIEELLDIAYACAQGVFPGNRRLGILTVSGGLGVQMADAADQYGLEVAPLPESAQLGIKAVVPFAGTINPIDVTAQATNDKTVIGRCLEIVLSEGNYGSIVFFLTSAPAMPDFADMIFDALEGVRQRYPACLIVLSFVAPPDVVRRFEAAGFLVFEDANRAVRAIAATANFSSSFGLNPGPTYRSLDASRLPSIPSALTKSELQGLDEHGAKTLLAAAGIPMLAEVVAADASEVQSAAAGMAMPVALKIVSPDIQHKTEVDGVVLGLRTPEAAADAAARMLAHVRQLRPDARLRGVLVSPMCQGGVETICGVFRDPVFGPVVMFGLGGIHVEVMRDVTFRLAPFDVFEAAAMVKEIRGFGILQGVRGAPAADIECLADILSRLSVFAYANRELIKEIDINPLMVMPRGNGAFALDALVVPVSE